MKDRSTFNLRRLGLLALLVGLAGSSGCSWESELYDNFVGSYGVVACPGLKSIQYEKPDSSIINIENGKQYDSVDIDYINAFNYEICPRGYLCDEKNSKCYKEGNTASTCSNNQYFDKHVNICVESTITSCGSRINDCTKIRGWKEGKCELNQCVATVCSDGYDLISSECVNAAENCTEGQYFNLTQKRCEDNNLENCGAFGKKCADAPGWANGECTKAGECEANTCLTGYHLEGTSCVADTNSACGPSAIDCKTDSTGQFCSEGICTDACTGGLATCTVNEQYLCANTTSDMEHCGDCNTPCLVENVAKSKSVTCRNMQCVATDCIAGYHLNIETYICEEDSVQNCGQVGRDCSAIIKGWANGACSAGECQASNCQIGYHLEGTACIADTNENCGSKGKACDTGTFCSEGKCAEACTGGLQNCDGYCANTTSDMSHCGGCNIKCNESKVSYSTSAVCRNSQCVAESCKSGYHLNGNACERDSVQNCGQVGRDCSKIISGWANGTCNTGACIASTCKTGYYLDGSTCVADSNTNCGKKGNACEKGTFCSEGKCTDACTGGLQNCAGYCANTNSDMQHCGGCNTICNKDKVSNSTTAICRNSQCVAESCRDGYHLNGNACEKDSVQNCGQTGRDCSKIITGWAGGTCNSGVCKATACTTGYYLDGSTCIADSNTNCGKKGNACKDGTFCSEGKCTDACTGGLQNCAGYCANTTSDMQHCGGCNAMCNKDKVPNSTTAICRNSQCVAESCQEGYHLNGSVCDKDSVQNCGQTGRDCSKIIAGWGSGSCEAGVCKASTCSTGYYLDDATCIADSNTNCGKKGNACKIGTFCSEGQCTDACTGGLQNCGGYCANVTSDMQHCGGCNAICNKEKVQNSSTAICRNTQCVAETCQEGYHLNGDTCEVDSIQNCGQTGRDCSKIISGWSEGTCDSGICNATKCTTGYYLDGTVCVADSNTNCGKKGNPCTAGTFCSEGQCTDACTGGLQNCSGYCANLTSDMQHCGGCNSPCTTGLVENALTVICSNSQCIAESCKNGFHLNGNACEKDSAQNCGQTGRDCSKIVSGWINGTCDSGVCKAEQCSTGYYLDNATCVADSNTNCGRKGNNCAAGTFCSEGQCTDACTGELENCSGYCANTSSDMLHCSACNTPCTTSIVKDSTSVICTSDGCVPSNCVTGKYPDGTECKPYDVNNCGAKGLSCKSQMAGFKTGTCSEAGVCQAQTCEDSYVVSSGLCIINCTQDQYFFGGKCQDSSETKCGSEVNNCTLLSGWENGDCIANKCTATSCKTGYKVNRNNQCEPVKCSSGEYLDGSTCKSYDVENCGAKGRACTSMIAGFKAGNCTNSGVCEATECEENYDLTGNTCISSCGGNQYFFDGDCVESTETACGNANNNCKSLIGWKSGTCSNNKCVAAECANGYKLNGDKICEAVKCNAGEYLDGSICKAYDVNNCGAKGQTCTTMMPGFKTGTCTANGICQASSCDENYDKAGTTCISTCGENQYFYAGSCQDSSKTKCGNNSNDCTKLPGWHTGDCENNKCVAEVCQDGFSVNAYKLCEAVVCDAGEYLDGSTCKPYDVNNCGAKNQDCSTLVAGFADGTCSAAGICQATKCEANYDKVGTTCVSSCGANQYYHGGQCLPSSEETCGSFTNNCTELTGWHMGECYNNKCKAIECDEGYKINSQNLCEAVVCTTGTYLDGSECKSFDTSNCGAKDRDCTIVMPGFADGSCTSSGICQASSCREGYDLVGTTCISGCGENEYYYNGSCKLSSETKCGSEFNNCRKLAGWKTGNCVDNQCEAETCTDSFLYNKVCTGYTNTKCGIIDAKLVNCNDTYPNSTQTACNLGTCYAISCKSGYTGNSCNECAENYRKNGEACKPINLDNSCGVDFTDCTAIAEDDTNHVSTASCTMVDESYTCNITCADGYDNTNGNPADGCEAEAEAEPAPGTHKDSCGATPIDCDGDGEPGNVACKPSGEVYVCSCNEKLCDPGVACTEDGSACQTATP